jgi:t-SNARE complex subunit (syntaxin)
METATATGTLSELQDTLLAAIKMLDGKINKMSMLFNKIEQRASNQQNEIEKLQQATKDEMAA